MMTETEIEIETESVVLTKEHDQPHQPQQQQVVEANSMRLYSRNDFDLFNLLQHPTWIFDVIGKKMFWANRASLRIWNATTLEELVSRDFKTDMSEATEARINKDLDRVIHGEVIQDQYTLYPCGKATTVHLTVSAIRIRNTDEEEDKDGHFAMLFECQRMVEQDSLVQDTVTRGVEMLIHLSMPVCQFDMNGKLQYQNPKAERLFNSTEHGKWKDFHTRFVDKELAKVILQKALNGDGYSVEAEHYTQDGPRWFFVTVKRARDPISSENVVLYSGQDITEVVEARKERATVHEKSEFFAVIAHEIRTPLHQIVGYLDLFELDGLRESQIEMLRIIQSSSSLLMSIINDLLDYTKLDNGKLVLERIPFSTRDVVKSCINTVEAQAMRKGLAIVDNVGAKEVQDLPETLLGDPNRIRQILLNFLSNAIKFTDHGKISINVSIVTTSAPAYHSESNKTNTQGNQAKSPNESKLVQSDMSLQSLLTATLPTPAMSKSPAQSQTCKPKNDKNKDVVVRFELSDTGIGIDPKHQAALFRKYQQGNSSISRNYGGTGLGLAICKSLADLMGARIGLTSEVGVGTTCFLEVPFELCDSPKSQSPYLEVPLEQCESISSPPMDGPAPQLLLQKSYEQRRMHILVVEDNKINQKLLCAMLKKLEYDISVAENGQVAVDMASCQHYNIILMDVQMPVMDGIEATKKIRAMEGRSSNDLAIIGLTAAYETSDLDYYKGIGMNTCLGKPVRLDGLKKAIHATLSLTSRQPNQ